MVLPLLLTLLAAQDAPPAEVAAGRMAFESDVRPVLEQHCVECHSGERPKSQLDLSTPSGLASGGARGPLLVPGDPDASLLAIALGYHDPELLMPPTGRLDAEVITGVRAWIAQGAHLPEGAEARPRKEGFDLEDRAQHWSFQPITDPEPPAVDDLAWSLEPIDAFVRAALQAAELEPAGAASPEAWLRRVTFALTGLPPTPEELDRFLAAPEERRAVVRRLMASPRFGETWARHWLDLVRYADTKGHEFDHPIPQAWRYRDWVVRALNARLPYDQFVREQIAGDLLDFPRRDEAWRDESIQGTGWWWLGEEVHSPVDTRLDETDRLDGQVDTLGKAFLGLTMGCARCHDHKFDPLSQEDYSALLGFARSTRYRQARFETASHNRALLDRVAGLRASEARGAGDVVRAAALAALTEQAPVLAAARAVLAPSGEAETAFEPEALEDFEREQWAPWVAEGDAFGTGPQTYEQTRHAQRDLAGSGARLVSSHALSRSDAATGTLTGPAFTTERGFLHLRVAGGKHDGTRVELEADGDVVARFSGENSNRFRWVRFDLAPYAGRTLRVRIVDEVTTGWGVIAVDELLLSDDPLAPREGAAARARRGRVLAQAAALGVPAEQLQAWVEGLPVAGPSPLGRPEDAPAESVILDVLAGDALTQDGAIFAVAGDGVVLHGDQRLPVRFGPAAAYEEPALEGLRTAPGTVKETGKINWNAPGRTLHTRTFENRSGRLSYLIRGKVHAYVAVDSHHLVSGPLHQVVVKTFDTGGAWRWVEHPLEDYRGHRMHVELSPATDGAVAGLRAVLDGPAPPAIQMVGRTLDEALLAGDPTDAELDRALPLLWPEGLPEAVRAELQPWLDEERSLLSELRLESATAPAAFDGSGVDELLLSRGSHKAPLREVPRAFPVALQSCWSGLAGIRGSGRLELADAILHPDNPLTARVAVNRVWHHLFGVGLVATPDDFGIMGQAPSHPELLDHLATELMRSGWDLHGLIERIVLSRTFGQASAADSAALESDPGNRLLHHYPVRPLTGEALRDAVLAVGGLLKEQQGGPAVPIHLTEFQEGRGRPGSGPVDGQGRRSLYLAVRRNFPEAFLTVFDRPNPSTPRGRRSTSNVPAQALAMLNDPLVGQAAAAWGRVLAEASGTVEERVALAVRTAFGRSPGPQEVARLVSFLGDDPGREAWEDLVAGLMSAKEFRYLR